MQELQHLEGLAVGGAGGEEEQRVLDGRVEEGGRVGGGEVYKGGARGGVGEVEGEEDGRGGWAAGVGVFEEEGAAMGLHVSKVSRELGE